MRDFRTPRNIKRHLRNNKSKNQREQLISETWYFTKRDTNKLNGSFICSISAIRR
jgi:hypothetical protein